jgi:hypothetical protein
VLAIAVAMLAALARCDEVTDNVALYAQFAAVSINTLQMAMNVLRVSYMAVDNDRTLSRCVLNTISSSSHFSITIQMPGKFGFRTFKIVAKPGSELSNRGSRENIFFVDETSFLKTQMIENHLKPIMTVQMLIGHQLCIYFSSVLVHF